MSLYYSIFDPTDVRDLDDLYTLWINTGNPKADTWIERPAPPAFNPDTQSITWTRNAEWEIIELPPVVYTFSKLSLMRRLDSIGKWEMFKELLMQLPEIVKDTWDLASEIRSDDPIFTAYSDAIKLGLNLSEEEYNTIIIGIEGAANE